MVAMAGQTTLALTDKQPTGRPIAEQVAADLPGGLEQLQGMPAWRLAGRRGRQLHYLDAYTRFQGEVIEFAWAAQAALRACAAGTPPAGRDHLLPGEDDGKGHAHDWPDLPAIPDGISQSRHGHSMSVLREADARLRDIYRAWELAVPAHEAGSANVKRNRIPRELRRHIDEWPEFLRDWADAAAVALATALRKDLPQPVPGTAAGPAPRALARSAQQTPRTPAPAPGPPRP
jgi:hypothetical protein